MKRYFMIVWYFLGVLVSLPAVGFLWLSYKFGLVVEFKDWIKDATKKG